MGVPVRHFHLAHSVNYSILIKPPNQFLTAMMTSCISLPTEINFYVPTHTALVHSLIKPSIFWMYFYQSLLA